MPLNISRPVVINEDGFPFTRVNVSDRFLLFGAASFSITRNYTFMTGPLFQNRYAILQQFSGQTEYEGATAGQYIQCPAYGAVSSLNDGPNKYSISGQVAGTNQGQFMWTCGVFYDNLNIMIGQGIINPIVVAATLHPNVAVASITAAGIQWYMGWDLYDPIVAKKKFGL